MPPTAAETPELIRRHGAEVMAVARRWAATPEDAEDAYQRGLEIMLTKAPATDPEELVPWLKTVVKHECFAARRQRERHTPPAGMVPERVDSPGEGSAHDHVERFERLRLGAEAMQRLKPQEVRALVLRAEGLSYREICEETGWTYTKVNRCLSEGRQRFAERLAGIESGAECERLAPLLSAVVDGEAGAEDLAVLRPHLRSCLVCRARLRDYREAPARAAALVPPVAGLPLLAWIQERIASFAVRWQAVIEATSAHKVAAVTASTAVLAGGGVATVATVEGDVERKPAPRVATRPADPPRAERSRIVTPASPPRRKGTVSADHTPASKQPAAPEGPAKQSPQASGEFDPAPDTSVPASTPRSEPATPSPGGEAGEFVP
jgi:RNA polymerase sigma factor (sigma-70 family)